MKIRNVLAIGTLAACLACGGQDAEETQPPKLVTPVEYVEEPVSVPVPEPEPLFVPYILREGETPWDLARADYELACETAPNRQQLVDETNELLRRSGFPILGAVDRCPPGLQDLEPVIQERCDKLYEGVAPDKRREVFFPGDVFLRRNPELYK